MIEGVEQKKDLSNRGAERRRFFIESVSAACGALVLAAGVGLYGNQAKAMPYYALRPPGALPEKQFLSACLRCGQCSRSCPYQILHIATLDDQVPTGTPYFISRQAPCQLCEDMPCIKACPSGALDQKIKDIYQSRMGLAMVVDQETCLNHLGLRCDVCYRACPLIDKAITLNVQVNKRTGVHALFIPRVHSEACTGCGKCERSCVLEEAAIKVLPLQQAKGQLGKHYRLGWEEKEKAKGSLIPEALKLPIRRPEGSL